MRGHGDAGAVRVEPDDDAVRGGQGPRQAQGDRRDLQAVLGDLHLDAVLRRRHPERRRRRTGPAEPGGRLSDLPVRTHGRGTGTRARLYGRAHRRGTRHDVGVVDGQHPARHVEFHARRPRPRARHGVDHHLADDGEEVADVVGIPFDDIQQACLSPLAYTVGTDFKRAMRPEPDSIIHWDTW